MNENLINELKKFSNRVDLEMENYIAQVKQDLICEIKDKLKSSEEKSVNLNGYTIKYDNNTYMVFNSLKMDGNDIVVEGTEWVNVFTNTMPFSYKLKNFSLEIIQSIISFM